MENTLRNQSICSQVTTRSVPLETSLDYSYVPFWERNMRFFGFHGGYQRSFGKAMEVGVVVLRVGRTLAEVEVEVGVRERGFLRSGCVVALLAVFLEGRGRGRGSRSGSVT